MCFTAGQPLGYYSSWPLFALSHHILIWWVAEQVHPGVVFKDYAVLGDDVVIADQQVAALYETTIKELGVSISYTKSLISNNGSCEFAKRFMTRGLTKDLSPVSIRRLMGYHHPIGLMGIYQQYPTKRFSTFLRIGGYGYKSISRPDDKTAITLPSYVL